MQNVVIIIPYYKNNINDLERVSIVQMMKILKPYRKCFILPDKVDKVDIELDDTCEIKRFQNECFLSPITYSKLLLSADFYKIFASYEFMLIYQMDAFVFKDELETFCRTGYDYIGAPWFLFSWMYEYSKSLVGNGGFSLRNIEKTIRILEDNEALIKEKFYPHLHIVGEDVVFSWFGKQADYDYKVAPYNIARKFALECDFHKAFKKLDDNLPFGCHHWWNSDFEVWKKYVEKEGYTLGEYSYAIKAGSRKSRFFGAKRYLLKRIFRNGDRKKFRDILKKIIDDKKKVIMWGLGIAGERCLKVLTFAGVEIEYIIDKCVTDKEKSENIPLVTPDKVNFASVDVVIVVSAVKYYDEIASYLTNLGLKENVDFIHYWRLEKDVIWEYYDKILTR